MTLNSGWVGQLRMATITRVTAGAAVGALAAGVMISAPASASPDTQMAAAVAAAGSPQKLTAPTSRKTAKKSKKVKVSAAAAIKVGKITFNGKGRIAAKVAWDGRLSGSLKGKSRYSMRVLTYQGSAGNPKNVKQIGKATRFVERSNARVAVHNRVASKLAVVIKQSKRVALRSNKIAITFTQVHDTNGSGGWEHYALDTVAFDGGLPRVASAKKIAKQSRSSTNFQAGRAVSRAQYKKHPRLGQSGFGADLGAFSCPGYQNEPIQNFTIAGSMKSSSFQCLNLTQATIDSSPDTNVNLADSDFAGADISRLSFNFVNLSGAKFASENWNSMTTGPADTFAVSFSCASLVNAHFAGISGPIRADCADLSGADFTNANLAGSMFTGANMVGAQLPGANLSWCSRRLTGWENCGLDGVKPNPNGKGVVPNAQLFLAPAVFVAADLTNANLANAVTNQWTSTTDPQTLNSTQAQAYMPLFNGVNLSGATLTGVQLAGIDFSSQPYVNGAANTGPANFAGTDFSQLAAPGLMNVNVAGANFNSANLSNQPLGSANLNYAVLIKAILTNATFTNADLTNTVFSLHQGDCSTTLNTSDLVQAGVTLAGVYLEYCDLSGLDFSQNPLTDAHLEGANLNGATLSVQANKPINLGAIHLEGADLTGATLTDAAMVGAHLQNATLTNATTLTGADLTNANFTSVIASGTPAGAYFGDAASLSGANFTSANLTNASFQGLAAQTVAPNFQGAQLNGSILSFANLAGSNFAGANFSGATLEATDLSTGTASGLNNQASCTSTTWYDGTTKSGPCYP